MIKALSNKTGGSYIWTVIIILAASMIFSAVFTYVSLMITVGRTREDTQRVLDSFVIENATGIYQSIKSGHHTTLSDFFDERFRTLVATELGLTQTGSAMFSEINDRNIMFHYNPVTTSIRGGVLELQTRFDMAIPVSFAGNRLFYLHIPLEVKSLYVLK
jgi:hypothetical protein